MKNFTNITNSNYSFSTCDICQANCCSGVGGTVFSQIILEDFKTVSKNFPILFTFGELGFLKAVILFTNGKDYCPYIKDNRCTIYNQRPTICKIYPLSPEIDDNFYIDLNCPAVINSSNNQTGLAQTMVKNGEITNKYFHEVFLNYKDKYIQTHQELEQFNQKEKFEEVVEVNNIKFYKYTLLSDNQYIQTHQESLKNLNNII